MTALSVPAVVLATIAFYAGIYHALLYARRRAHRRDLSFALTCLTIGVYDLLCVGLYHASSPEQGVLWQRWQVVALAFVGPAFLLFLSDYTRQASRHALLAFTGLYMVSAVAGIANYGALSWTAEPNVRVMDLPFGVEVVYNEMRPGPLSNLQGILSVAFFAYVLIVCLRMYAHGDRKRARWPLLAIMFFGVGVLNDTAVNTGVYDFVYVIEYSYMGLVLVMTYALSDELVDAATVKKALQDSEEKHRGLLEHLPQRIFHKDARSVFVSCNKNFADDLGIAAHEVSGKTDFDFYPKELAEKYRADDHRLMETGQTEALEESHIKDSRECFVQTVKTPLTDDDGNVTGILGIFWDITERKQAEEERERLMSAIGQAAEAVVITDVDGTIQYVNPAFERITGYARDEAIGQNPHILKSSEQDGAFYEEMWGTLTRGETWTGRFVNKKKDGTLYTEEATISPVHDGSGKTVNYVGVKRDITQVIKLEDQLRQAQKMEAVGQLAGGVAHDFNNLLQAILGYGEMALARTEPGTPIVTSIEEILKAGTRAATLVRQLLAFSRQQVLEMKDVDLNTVIADLMKMTRRVIGEHITLGTIAGHDLGIVRADPGQIEQILMNLCVNARDAMPGGGTITIETGNVRIDKTYCENRSWAIPGRYVLLSVTDTGCGMDDDTLANVFEPFFTTKELGEGTGLGLSTVYGLVKQHHGMIDVYSEVDQGTTFKVYLPQVERSALAVGDKIEGSVPTGTETVLVAEDDETVRELTKAILERVGYTVLTASDGEEALTVFGEHANEIDLALLDVMMPKLGGRAVFQQIRQVRPDLRFLFASGYSMNAIHTNFVLDEGLALVQKPYQCDDLLRRVRDALDGT